MEESHPISWRAKLAKANINILDIKDNRIFLEFTYHPKPGIFKWCKTVFSLAGIGTIEEQVGDILNRVLELRKELEGSYGSKR